jgi:hypothetical protein
MFGLGAVDASVPETEIRQVLRPQPIWIPSHPRETVALLPQPRVSPPQTLSPFLNMDFGGQCGENLAHLVKMVVHLSKDSSAAVGTSFYFDNQRAVHFGNRGRERVFTHIDGPGGERIRASSSSSRRKVAFRFRYVATPLVLGSCSDLCRTDLH